MVETIPLSSVLNRAESGLALARAVLDRIHSVGNATLDFSVVDRVTPSFANAFVMTLLQSGGADVLSRVTMLNRNDQVARAMADSAERFARGRRLSSQQPVFA